MGTLSGKLAPTGSSSHGITWLSDPIGLPQVNGTVESLGERRGYAPFSPDENSLVLFDGRAVAGAQGSPEGCCPRLGEGDQLSVWWPRPQGGTSRSSLPLPMPLPLCPGDEVYSTIRKQEYNGKIPRFRRIQGEIELYTSDTVMQSESGSRGAGVDQGINAQGGRWDPHVPWEGSPRAAGATGESGKWELGTGLSSQSRGCWQGAEEQQTQRYTGRMGSPHSGNKIEEAPDPEWGPWCSPSMSLC